LAWLGIGGASRGAARQGMETLPDNTGSVYFFARHNTPQHRFTAFYCLTARADEEKFSIA